MPTIHLQSSDGKVFDIDEQISKCSGTIQMILEDWGMYEDVFLTFPNVNSAIMRKVLQWANYHKDDPKDDENTEKRTDDISLWDADFLKVDQDTLFELILAANYMDTDGLLGVICKSVAKMNGKTLEEIRKTFNITDFSAAEQAQVRKECESVNLLLAEVVNWLATGRESKTQADLLPYRKVGARLTTLDNETLFCNENVLHGILNGKTAMDGISHNKLRSGRNRSNPFEALRSSVFSNRAAIKMANIDAILGFMFTDPKDENGVSQVKDLLYFADVCSGPGGFSEYVLYRKKESVKGFGFTLRSKNDFKLEKVLVGRKKTFDTYYGVKGDGNILNPENIESLQQYVLSETGTGVHTFMADGGFFVDDKNIQEIKSKQLYLCQCLTALSLLRDDGSCVVKLFDIFTRFSVGLVYLMYKCFKQICILKPNTSRPASSERYLICKYKLSNTDTIRQHLFDINREMWSNPNADVDTLELVPLEVLTEDQGFFNYIVESNNRIGRNQIASLLKIVTFTKDLDLIDHRQEDIRKESLRAWKLPEDKGKNWRFTNFL